MNEKAELINSLKFLYDSLLGIEDISAQKETLIREAESCQAEIQNTERKRRMTSSVSNAAKKGASVGKVIGIIATIIIMFIVYTIVALFYAMIAGSNGSGSMMVINIIGLICLGITGGIIFLIVKGSGAVSKISDSKSQKSDIEAQDRITACQRRIQYINTKEIPETDAKLIIAYQDAQDLIEVFPPNYCYSDAVGKVIFYIENQRADTIKEALNMYEQEIYQNKMLAHQERQTRAAEISAKANVISAAANVVTAFNTGQIAANTSQMVGSLRNIEGYSAQTAANTAAAARSAAATASNTANAANSAASMADYVRQIRNSL